jgi:hypothetical protein
VPDVEMQVAERPLGVFSRQLFLGDTLDIENIAANYEAGVLTLRIPVARRRSPARSQSLGLGLGWQGYCDVRVSAPAPTRQSAAPAPQDSR